MGELTSILVILSLLGFGEPGTTVMPLLGVDQGPRLAAMGGTGIGAVDDASAIYWNPAGLSRAPGNCCALSHHEWFAGIRDEVVHAAMPAGPGTVGLGLMYSGEPGIESWDAGDMPGDTFRTWAGVLSAGYGLTIGPNWRAGATLKGFFEDLRNSSGSGGALDVGVSYQPSAALILGAVGRNVGVAKYSSSGEDTPFAAGIGGSFEFGSVLAVADVVLPVDNSLALHVGAEYTPVRELAVRLGYKTGAGDIATLGAISGLTAGLGVRTGVLSLDYAVTPYGRLGTAHRIGLALQPRSKPTGSLKLRIVDGTNMLPLVASLSLSGVEARQIETGSSGELELPKLPAGKLVVYASRSGYTPRLDTVQVAGGRAQSVTIALSPLAYGTISGTVADAGTGSPISGSVSCRGPVGGTAAADSATGSYELRNLPAGRYGLTATGPSEDYLAQTCTLEVAAGRTTNRDFYLVKRRQTIVLTGVNFETGSADLLPQFDSMLARAGEILRANPGISVELAGHTDPREIATARFPSNQELSRARAEAVRQYLIAKWGIAPERLVARGYADTQPIAPNTTEEGMAKNRRTEFRIIGQ
jgi:outer membrane protein OmpA-like peptidoglycan-associated protein